MNWLKLFTVVLILSSCSQGDRGKVYVTSQNSGVTVIDLNSMEVVDEFKVGGFPRGIGLTKDGKYLVTANKDDASISLVNVETKVIEKTIEVGINPEFVRIKDGLAFISTEPSSKGKPPAPGEQKHEEEEDDDRTPAKVSIVDLALGEKVRDITAGPETEGIEFSKDGKQIIVTNEADNTITVHDFISGELIKTISVEPYGKRPRGIKVSPNGEHYIATLEHSYNFIVLDRDFNHLKTVSTGKSPYGTSFNAEGDKLFVAAGKSKTLEVYDATDYSKIKDINIEGKRCWHFTFTPDNQDILLACGRSDEIVVVDVGDLAVEKRIPVAGIPWGIVSYPPAIGSLDQPR